MCIPKFKRDEQQGVSSPAPTQVVSNEEYILRPQTVTKLKTAYIDNGGQRENADHGWVLAEVS